LKEFKSHFKFNKQERSGIFYVLLGIVLLLALRYYIANQDFGEPGGFALNTQQQERIDSLKTQKLLKGKQKIYPFNPNYLTDYKGYVLGMTPNEIDRLHIFRANNGFVNSAEEFQVVTKVSDSLLEVISPYFKYPEWANKRQHDLPNPHKKRTVNTTLVLKDLNAATAQDLKKVNGIGDKLSARIVKFRDRLGGFLVKEQLYDVYGLEPEVVRRAFERFHILEAPKIEKININTASVKELSTLIYIPFDLAENIVMYRQAHGEFKQLDDLLKIDDYPVNKNERIKLYLRL